MKIKLLRSKIVNGSVEPVNRIVDVPERVAKKWLEAKEAEALTPGLDTAVERHLLDRQGRGEKKSKPAEAKE